MIIVGVLLLTKIYGFLWLLSGEGGASVAVYHVEKRLTPVGWIVIVGWASALIFGLICLVVKIIKNQNSND